MMRRFANPWVWFGALALVILGPLLRSGFVLNFDMVFTPRIALETSTSNQYLVVQLFRLLNTFLSSPVIEKLVLFVILLLAGVGAYRMVERLGVRDAWWGAAFASVLYMVNPFTYSRLMAGQYLVLGGYALLPWFVVALDRFIRRPGWGTSLRLGLWATLIGVISVHSIFMLLLLGVVMVAVAYARHNQRRHLGQWLKFGLIGVVTAAILSSYWLIPLIMGSSAEAKTIAGFTAYDTNAFRTDGGILGLPWNVLALSGFWGDRQGRYTLPWQVYHGWGIVMLVIGLLAAAGLVFCWRRKDYVGISLAIVAALAGVLALGTAWGPVAGLNTWLYAHLPFFKGYREPQKFVALIALAYAYLGGQTINWFQRHASVPRWVIVPLVLVPLLTAPNMLWAAGGQLRTVNYPADWYSVNQRLAADHSGSKTLFLPWHEYLSFPFEGRVIANPASSFFDTPVVAGDNPEVAPGEPQSARTRFVLDTLAPAGEQGQDVSGLLRQHGIKYIIVAKTADYRRYDWLKIQPHIKLVTDGPTLTLYEVTHG